MVTEPIRDKQDIRAIAEHLRSSGHFRDYAMFLVGISTGLRISDLLRLKWADIYDEQREEFREHIQLTEKKTGKHKIIALNDVAIHALCVYLPHRKGTYVFASRKGDKPISRQHAHRIIRDACVAVGVEGNISCHSLRKTLGYHLWLDGAASPVVIMKIFNHADFAVTMRYLGVEQDDLDRAYRSVKLL